MNVKIESPLPLNSKSLTRCHASSAETPAPFLAFRPLCDLRKNNNVRLDWYPDSEGCGQQPRRVARIRRAYCEAAHRHRLQRHLRRPTSSSLAERATEWLPKWLGCEPRLIVLPRL